MRATGARLQGAGARLALLGLLMAATVAPAGAQQMMRVLERGPVGYLHGHTLLQVSGDLTAGDFSHPATADWDADGRADLIVGSGYGDLLYFARQDSGLFSPARGLVPEVEVGLDATAQRQQVSPWLGDLEGDGVLDLLLGISDRVYRYRVRGGVPGDGLPLLGVGDLPRAPGPLRPAVMDCDGDGNRDLIIADGSGRLHYLPLALAGSAQLQPLAAAGEPIVARPPVRPCAGDWDGDGRCDLLLGDGLGHIILYRAGPQGLAAEEMLGGGETRWLPGGQVAREVAPWITDWDGDGDADLLVGCRGGFVSLLERTGPAQMVVAGLLQQQFAPVDAGRCAVAVAGDWDGDGDADLIVGGEDGYVTWYERLPDEGIMFARGRRLADEHGPVRAQGVGDAELRYAAPSLVDWDGDGDLDLLVGCGSGAVLIWLNAGSLRPLGTLRVGGEELKVGGLAMPAPCDANGDGDTDLFVGARELPAPEDVPAVPALPQFAPAVAYFENTTDRPSAPPQFAKGVPIAMVLFSRGDPPLNRDADFLAPYATWPAPWNGTRPEFITNTSYGTFVFTNTSRPGAYARLQLECVGRALPRPLLPPLFSARPAELVRGEIGLLAADEAYGFVCYYPRSLFPR